MSDRRIDPFKHIGTMQEWGKFGDGEHDQAAFAEQRSLAEHFLRRLKKGDKRGADVRPALFAGGMTAFAGLFIACAGGPEQLSDEDFEKWIGVATFAWYQAIGCYQPGPVVQ